MVKKIERFNVKKQQQKNYYILFVVTTFHIYGVYY